MGRVVDILHIACGELKDDIKLIHDQTYMMNIFDKIAEEIPEFQDFLTNQFKHKQIEFIKSATT